MIVRLHRFTDFLSGFAFSCGSHYYNIDERLIQEYKQVSEEYEAVENELIEQYVDPKRKLNKVPCFVEEEIDDDFFDDIKDEEFSEVSLGEKI